MSTIDRLFVTSDGSGQFRIVHPERKSKVLTVNISDGYAKFWHSKKVNRPFIISELFGAVLKDPDHRETLRNAKQGKQWTLLKKDGQVQLLPGFVRPERKPTIYTTSADSPRNKFQAANNLRITILPLTPRSLQILESEAAHSEETGSSSPTDSDPVTMHRTPSVRSETEASSASSFASSATTIPLSDGSSTPGSETGSEPSTPGTPRSQKVPRPTHAHSPTLSLPGIAEAETEEEQTILHLPKVKQYSANLPAPVVKEPPTFKKINFGFMKPIRFSTIFQENSGAMKHKVPTSKLGKEWDKFKRKPVVHKTRLVLSTIPECIISVINILAQPVLTIRAGAKADDTVGRIAYYAIKQTLHATAEVIAKPFSCLFFLVAGDRGAFALANPYQLNKGRLNKFLHVVGRCVTVSSINAYRKYENRCEDMINEKAKKPTRKESSVHA